MPGSIIGHLLLEEYEKVVLRVYCEPKDEIIMGKFIESVDCGIVEQDQRNQNQPVRKKRKTEKNKSVKLLTFCILQINVKQTKLKFYFGKHKSFISNIFFFSIEIL